MNRPNHPSFLERIPENCLFWIFLLLMSMGAVTTFYYQGNMALQTMNRHVYTEIRIPQNERILTIYEDGTQKPRTVILTDDAGAIVKP